MGTINTKGAAKRSLNADIIDIIIEFTTESRYSKGAVSECKKNCEEFLDKLSELGLNIKDIQLFDDRTQTTKNYSTDETLYMCERKIGFTIPAESTYVNLILSLIEAFNYPITYDTNYSLSNRYEIETELLSEAMEDARKKADVLSGAVETKVTGIKSIDTSSQRKVFYDAPAFIDIPQFLSDASSTPKSDLLASKEIEVEAIVHVAWYTDGCKDEK